MTAVRTDASNRNASLDDLTRMLRDEHTRKVDVVSPAKNIGARDGMIVVDGAEPQLDDDGITLVDGVYRPTRVFDEGVANKLGIPVGYLRRMRDERPDMYDANVNGWLHGRKAKVRIINDHGDQRSDIIRPAIDGDPRSFLIRAFRGDDTGHGVARAFLSDRYRMVDNLDALMSALDGIRDAGVNVNIAGCDLTERRMRVRVVAPEVKALAPTLLRGYRSPFSGASGDDNPVVFAGFEISNSEVGSGAFSIVPRLEIEVCRNGMTVTQDALRAVHLGSRLDDGVVRWSEDTQEKNVDLIKAKTRDAVRTFVDHEYMTRVLADIEGKADKEVDKPEDTIKALGKKLQFTEDEQDTILAHFIQGGQMTAGGMLNAVTSTAQTLDDGDAAADMEDRALRVLDLV